MTQTAEAWLSELTNLYAPMSTQSDAGNSHVASIEACLDVAQSEVEADHLESVKRAQREVEGEKP